ncbi:hypothetical protein Q5Y75_26350 [Ruegeria sp. 2205SS24-7]|uniref:hypothetical protein n=1 Tax=Ruegeria discodermiae TaxID=3064389 RepID=UPI00274216EA|nr:hypothetical protein [Ruegeria sp. 2205SS24-7]MDP5220714.1 hypothetical protein [Ruegeria sp. 2205SS24-7]
MRETSGKYPHLTNDPNSYPRQLNRLSGAIRRLQPPLRRTGVTIAFERHGHAGECTFKIESA